jgi:hypothetical protein
MLSAYACAVLGIAQALLGMVNALAAAWPCRNGPPNGPAGLRVSAMRQGVTGTKLKPVIADSPMNAAEAAFSVPLLRAGVAGTSPEKAGIALGEALGTGAGAAEDWARDADVGVDVPLTPPHPAKENTIRDKQINARVPETKKEWWRRIDYPSATKGQQLWGCGAWIIINSPKMSIGLIGKILFN